MNDVKHDIALWEQSNAGDVYANKRALAICCWHKAECGSAVVRQILHADEDDLEVVWHEMACQYGLPTFQQAISEGKRIEYDYGDKKTTLLCPGDPQYPQQLHVLKSPPILGVKGNIEILKKPQMAVVGSRHTIETSLRLTPIIADALMISGYILTSGGAMGIDALAHRQAMVRLQPTIVVSAMGTEQVYPKENTDIFDYAAQHGAVVSQFPNTKLNHKPNFPQRNDVIAGLSEGVVLIQCPHKSGALYTVNAARRFHRPVFVAAMPGFDPLTEGGLACIKKNHAKLLSTLDDLRQTEHLQNVAKQKTLDLSLIQTPSLTAQALPEAMMSITQTAILKAIQQNSMTREILRQNLDFPNDFDEAILELELNGHIQTIAGVVKCA